MFASKVLRDEHEGILVVLEVMEHLAGEVRAGAAVNTRDLADLLDFLRVFADRCHHGKEEGLLFPALQAVGVPVDGGPIGVMLQEHAEGRGYIRGMAHALEHWDDGMAARRDYAANALAYVELLRAHIRKENMVLFNFADQLLPAQTQQDLLAAFERKEHEEIGDGVHEAYHAMIHTLRDRYLRPAA